MFQRELSDRIESYKNLIPFLKPYWLYGVGIIVSLSLTAGALISFGVGIKFLIDKGFTFNQQSQLNQSVLILLCISLVMSAGSFARYYLSSLFAEKVVADLKKFVFEKLITFSPKFFEDFRVGEILTRLNTDTALLKTTMGAYASTGLRSLLQIIGALVMLFYTSPKLTGLVFILIPFVIIPIFFLGKKVKRLGRKAQDNVGHEGAYIEETFSGIRTVQAFCREALHARIFGLSIAKSLEVSKEYTWLRSLLVAYVITIVFAAISFLLWVGGYEVIKGNLTPGSLTSFVFFGIISAASINSVLELSGNIQRGLAAADRLFEILNHKPALFKPPKIYPLPPSAKGSMTVQGLTFYYPSRPSQPSLKNVSFSIKPGEKVAIVGPSGAGKSTLLNLFLRFYEYQEGGINIDEVDIRQLSLETLRSTIGIVPQEPFIFNASVYDNIAYGRYQATPEEVKKAADLAYASEFIERLPEKYETVLGEKGIRLSGGQRQRLAIARVVLKNPLILLLDEATNALDAESEYMVQQALEKVMQNRTTLIVAHRLSTVQSTDRIIVLDKGHVIATGTHHKLINQEGLYQRLANLQFKSG